MFDGAYRNFLLAGLQVENHVVFVHIGVTDFERATLEAEGLEAGRRVQARGRCLIRVHAESDLLEAGL